METEGVGERGRERRVEVIFLQEHNYSFLTKFRGMSRQSVICIIKTYSHIYTEGVNSWIFNVL